MYSRTTIDGTSFLNWLVKTKGLKLRSAKDVCSRYKRALKIMEIDPADEYLDIAYYLSKKNSFQILPYSVKSQLKRSILLYREYFNKHKTSIINNDSITDKYIIKSDVKVVAED